MKCKSEFKHGFTNPKAFARRYSVKMFFVKISQNSQENTCTRDSFLIKLTLAQVFSCEFCEIFKNTFFCGIPPVAVSPNRGYLHCAILAALHASQEKRDLKGYAVFSSKYSKWDFQDFQNVWKQPNEIHQSSLLNW